MLELTEQMYDSLSIKDLTATFPTSFYYNETFPLGQIFVWPMPTVMVMKAVFPVFDPVFRDGREMSLESERVGLVHERCFHAGSEGG